MDLWCLTFSTKSNYLHVCSIFQPFLLNSHLAFKWEKVYTVQVSDKLCWGLHFFVSLGESTLNITDQYTVERCQVKTCFVYLHYGFLIANTQELILLWRFCRRRPLLLFLSFPSSSSELSQVVSDQMRIMASVELICGLSDQTKENN